MKIIINKTSGVSLIAVLLTTVVCSQALAHHALNAFFDLDSPLEISGTLTSVRWTNPHIAFELESTEPNGETVSWRVESGSPVLLRREGINAHTFTVGDITQTLMADYDKLVGKSDVDAASAA